MDFAVISSSSAALQPGERPSIVAILLTMACELVFTLQQKTFQSFHAIQSLVVVEFARRIDWLTLIWSRQRPNASKFSNAFPRINLDDRIGMRPDAMSQYAPSVSFPQLGSARSIVEPLAVAVAVDRRASIQQPDCPFQWMRIGPVEFIAKEPACE